MNHFNLFLKKKKSEFKTEITHKVKVMDQLKFLVMKRSGCDHEVVT